MFLAEIKSVEIKSFEITVDTTCNHVLYFQFYIPPKELLQK